jgi:NADP-dependent 3-hydroxy acid dehydrogenase YdfG
MGGALERFGRVDTLINNAGVFISKPFTDYTAADYALMARRGLHQLSPPMLGHDAS